ncbi:hypothetical protein [Curtobacterium sp. MCPF17_051]|jgi:hypothetical protein|nr:hypothetical protein [Curtobacterium sp. MCPF17_051]
MIAAEPRDPQDRIAQEPYWLDDFYDEFIRSLDPSRSTSTAPGDTGRQ